MYIMNKSVSIGKYAQVRVFDPSQKDVYQLYYLSFLKE